MKTHSQCKVVTPVNNCPVPKFLEWPVWSLKLSLGVCILTTNHIFTHLLPHIHTQRKKDTVAQLKLGMSLSSTMYPLAYLLSFLILCYQSPFVSFLFIFILRLFMYIHVHIVGKDQHMRETKLGFCLFVLSLNYLS